MSKCLTDGCDSGATMRIEFNGMCAWFCDPCCQKYLAETKAFFAIAGMERLAPGPTPQFDAQLGLLVVHK